MARDHYDHEAKRWVWRCDGCGKQEHWNDDWAWYGSYLDAEASLQGNIVAACSNGCMIELQRQGRAGAHRNPSVVRHRR